ncbi:MAG: Small-conductance mechanosensitive channel [Chloroflexi bacterium]|nr:Small-conductance mechanosensitive channel [Chloroflexota bacterium]
MNEFINNIIAELERIFSPASLGERFVAWIGNAISALLIFLVFYLLWKILKRITRSILEGRKEDETTRAFILTVIKYTVLIIGGISALSALGIDVGAMVASLGIAGITIGFAARDAFSNLISGLLIFLDRPFVIGDLVEVGDNYGEVDQITLRSTRIITSDGRMLAVPNTEMINKTVASYTNFPHLRLDMGVTIGVNEEIEPARQLLLEIVQDDPAYLTDPEPKVLVKALNDYNVLLELRVWLKNERKHVGKRADLREKIFNTFNEAGVDMPFETIQLTPLDVELSKN